MLSLVGLVSPSPFYPLVHLFLEKCPSPGSLVSFLCSAAFPTAHPAAHSHHVGICGRFGCIPHLFPLQGVLVSLGSGDWVQGSELQTLMNFLLQTRASAETRIFTVMVFTHLNFAWYTKRKRISTSTCIKIFIPSFWSNNFIPTYGTSVPCNGTSV